MITAGAAWFALLMSIPLALMSRWAGNFGDTLVELTGDALGMDAPARVAAFLLTILAWGCIGTWFWWAFGR